MESRFSGLDIIDYSWTDDEDEEENFEPRINPELIPKYWNILVDREEIDLPYAIGALKNHLSSAPFLTKSVRDSLMFAKENVTMFAKVSKCVPSTFVLPADSESKNCESGPMERNDSQSDHNLCGKKKESLIRGIDRLLKAALLPAADGRALYDPIDSKNVMIMFFVAAGVSEDMIRSVYKLSKTIVDVSRCNLNDN